MIQITPRIAIDDSELEFEFLRSSGPGGQNVNKVETAVRLRFEFYDNSISSTFAVSGGRYAGWSIDNVEVYACP